MTKGSVYMRWAKDHAAARYNLANSGLLGCTAEDLDLAPGDLQNLLTNGANADGYPPLLAAIGARYGVPAQQVVTAPGASGANFLAFAALVEPGDEVLVERPAYEPLLAALGFLGARIRRFERRFEEGWRLDPDAVRPLLAGRPRLVVLTSPHNPSGVAADRADIAEVARLAAEAGALVLVDEVYLDAAAGEGEEPPSHVHLGPNVLATNSLTKSYGLSGLRCGWVLAAPELAGRMLRVRDLMAAADSMPSDALALAAFRQLPRLAARARTLLEPNRELVRAFLAEHADRLACVVPSRSMVVFPRLLNEETSDALHDRLRELDTSIVPGRFFGEPRHFRLGFALGADVVARGLENLSRAL